MWWRTLKTAGYSTELADLRDYVRGGTNPYDYAHFVEDFLEDHPEHQPEEEYDGEPDSYEYGYYWLDRASEAQQKAFIDYLDNHSGRHHQDGYLAYDSPVYNTLDYRRTLKPDWLVHFTDDARGIEQDGFAYGHPDMEGVHLTTWKQNRQQAPGYNFAFPADSRDARGAASEGKYGNEAVVFYSGGIQFDHSGDQESQVIVWGPHVNKEMIFPMKKYGGDGWIVEDYTGRELVAGQTYQEAVEFIKNNWQMLKSTRDKHRKPRRR
jgi:hypothetical protein